MVAGVKGSGVKWLLKASGVKRLLVSESSGVNDFWCKVVLV